MPYRRLGRQKTLSLCVYPATTLVKARKLREKARVELAGSIDPNDAKQVRAAECISVAKNITSDRKEN
jgi:hypothetical protein